MPIDIIRPFLELLEKAGKPAALNGAAHLPASHETSLPV
jgi:hypothetical protein